VTLCSLHFLDDLADTIASKLACQTSALHANRIFE